MGSEQGVTDADHRGIEDAATRNALIAEAQRWHIENAQHRRQRIRLASAAQREAATCGKCGQSIPAGAPIWLGSVWIDPSSWQIPLGACCQEGGGRWDAPEPCAGGQRPVSSRSE